MKKLSLDSYSCFVHFVAAGYYFALYILSVWSCLFVIFPTYYLTSDEYYMHVAFVLFLSLNMMGNYFLGVTNKSTYNTGVLLDEVPRTWILCLACQQHCPPRSHHCNVCDTCVLKHDHHCFFFGTCVGLRNLKYFVPYTFYVAISSVYIMVQLSWYLNEEYVPIELSWTSLFSYTFPGIPYNFLWPGAENKLNLRCATCLMTMYGTFSTAAGCAFLFIGSFLFLLRGQTSFEFQKDIRTYNLGVWKNFKMVFGTWGILCFIFPVPNRTREENSPWGEPKYIKGV